MTGKGQRPHGGTLCSRGKIFYFFPEFWKKKKKARLAMFCILIKSFALPGLQFAPSPPEILRWLRAWWV